jgi:hypothetical protein
VLKCIEYFLFVLWIDEGREAHVAELLDVVVLVRTVTCIRGLLHLKHGPSIVVENEEVENALSLIRVLLHDEATREQSADLLLQVCLVVSF